MLKTEIFNQMYPMSIWRARGTWSCCVLFLIFISNGCTLCLVIFYCNLVFCWTRSVGLSRDHAEESCLGARGVTGLGLLQPPRTPGLLWGPTHLCHLTEGLSLHPSADSGVYLQHSPVFHVCMLCTGLCSSLSSGFSSHLWHFRVLGE